MPFYLVTQTTLIDADNEEAAAEKTLSRIRAGNEVAFSVKYDDATIKRVLVSRPALTSAEAVIRQDITVLHFQHPQDFHTATRRPMPLASLLMLFLTGFGLGGVFVFML